MAVRSISRGAARRSRSAAGGVAAREDRVGAGMGRWRREFPEIDCSGKAIVGRLLHLRETMLAEINRALAGHGLKYPEFAVLATLRVEGAPFRMTPKALLDALILTSGGLSNLVRRLEQAGYVRRLPDARDGRGVIVELTAGGRRLVEPAMRDHAATERRLIAALGSGARVDLARSLARLMAAPHRAGSEEEAG